MATILYLLDTPSGVAGALPNDTQFPSFTVIGANAARLPGSNIPRTLSTTTGLIASQIPGTEYENVGIPPASSQTSFARLFVSDPVIGGFYVPGPIRLYESYSNTNPAVSQFSAGAQVVTYFWRPSTGKIVSGTGVAQTNYQLGSVNASKQVLTGSPVTFDDSGLGPEYGWVVQTGDVFVLELAFVFIIGSGSLNQKFTYEILFGGNIQTTVSASVNAPNNPLAFIQLPFDLQFQQSTETKTKDTTFRDMFGLVGS